MSNNIEEAKKSLARIKKLENGLSELITSISMFDDHEPDALDKVEIALDKAKSVLGAAFSGRAIS